MFYPKYCPLCNSKLVKRKGTIPNSNEGLFCPKQSESTLYDHFIDKEFWNSEYRISIYYNAVYETFICYGFKLANIFHNIHSNVLGLNNYCLISMLDDSKSFTIAKMLPSNISFEKLQALILFS